MYDRAKARDLGLITYCQAPCPEIQTVPGLSIYRCEKGHAHRVSWTFDIPHISIEAYNWAFLLALDAADDAAMGDQEQTNSAYHRRFNASLEKAGYGAVLVPLSTWTA